MNVTFQQCLLCGASSEYTRRYLKNDDEIIEDAYLCPNHGVYIISFKRSFEEEMMTKKLIDEYRVQLSGYLYELNQHETEDGSGNPTLNQDIILKIVNSPGIPKTPMQKLDKILLQIYSCDEGFNSYVDYVPAISIHIEKINFPIQLAYAKNEEELVRMFKALCSLGYLDKDEYIHRYTITYKGIEYAESLLSSNKNSNKVFVAMKFEKDMFKVLENAIKPACSECEFSAYTVNEKEHNNDITDEIIAGLKTSRFVIADFTYNNRGVYFEAGYAEGKGIEVIRTCKKEYYDAHVNGNDAEHKLHFDINHYNFIFWEDEKDLKEKLINRIKATIL